MILERKTGETGPGWKFRFRNVDTTNIIGKYNVIEQRRTTMPQGLSRASVVGERSPCHDYLGPR